MSIQSRNLPEDVIIDVLLRLPIQSLLRCRSVSKHWYVLLTSPSFIKLHLSRSSNAPMLLVAGYVCERGVRGLQRVNVCSLDGDNNKGASNVHFPFELPTTNNIKVQDSCNGLVCLSIDSNKTLALWNPATRECMSLEVPRCNSPYSHCDKFGIGFVPDTNDCKVVRLRARINRGLRKSITLISTYTLSSDSWESNEVVGPDVISEYSAYANGFLHWIAHERRGVRSIVSLDLRNGVFGQSLFVVGPSPTGVLLSQVFFMLLLEIDVSKSVQIAKSSSSSSTSSSLCKCHKVDPVMLMSPRCTHSVDDISNHPLQVRLASILAPLTCWRCLVISMMLMLL
ncbi:hypothetical protein RJ640_025881 [Escallonia rubra]|uniref:F-box domain-containing protein n=1 Tax=Escallonia rubra TaxID=112253 RepID=A0AA88RLL2_9ASTE|nr:hypothetical protein RJ640_025881 [Escallonia rubra]